MNFDLTNPQKEPSKPAPEKIHPLAVRTAKMYNAYCQHKGRTRQIEALMNTSFMESKEYGYKGTFQSWINWIRKLSVG
jgi:hypothetical protein